MKQATITPDEWLDLQSRVANLKTQIGLLEETVNQIKPIKKKQTFELVCDSTAAVIITTGGSGSITKHFGMPGGHGIELDEAFRNLKQGQTITLTATWEVIQE